MGAMTTATALPLPALVTAICAALALAGCGGLDVRGDLTERTETETVDAADVERIEITTDNGRVVVTTGASDAITVTARLQESDTGDADHTLRADGGRLLVAGHCDDGWFDRCSVGFEVTVPEDQIERARLAVQRMVDLPPPAVPSRYDMIKARHHVAVELI